MEIQTQITEVVEQVQVIKEIKKQKATITLEVNQDFVDLINFLGEIHPCQVKEISKNDNAAKVVNALWEAVCDNKELESILYRDRNYNFGLLTQPEQ